MERETQRRAPDHVRNRRRDQTRERGPREVYPVPDIDFDAHGDDVSRLADHDGVDALRLLDDDRPDDGADEQERAADDGEGGRGEVAERVFDEASERIMNNESKRRTRREWTHMKSVIPATMVPRSSR